MLMWNKPSMVVLSKKVVKCNICSCMNEYTTILKVDICYIHYREGYMYRSGCKILKYINRTI